MNLNMLGIQILFSVLLKNMNSVIDKIMKMDKLSISNARLIKPRLTVRQLLFFSVIFNFQRQMKFNSRCSLFASAQEFAFYLIGSIHEYFANKTGFVATLFLWY